MQTPARRDRGHTYRTFASEGSSLPRGTFDWQQRQLTFVTDAHVRSAIFSFQLRWATGIVWYDNVELEDLGPVVPVDTFWRNRGQFTLEMLVLSTRGGVKSVSRSLSSC